MASSALANQLAMSKSAFDSMPEVATDLSVIIFFVVTTYVWSRICPSCWSLLSIRPSTGKNGEESRKIVFLPTEPPVKQIRQSAECRATTAHSICEQKLNKIGSERHEAAIHAADVFDSLCTWPKELETSPAGREPSADTFDDLCTWPKELESLPEKSSKETMDVWQEPSDALYLFDNGDLLSDPWQVDEDLSSSGEAASEDARGVFEAAMSSGDPKLAESALAAGIRLCSATWLAQACSEFIAAGIQLDNRQLIEVMHAYSSENRADLAVDLWEAVCHSRGKDPEQGEADLYGVALEVCARCGDFETAARTASVGGWRAPPCKFGQDALLALARWFARRQDVVKASHCYEAVRDARGHADLATHRAVLIASVRSADMAQAEELFKAMIYSGLVPDGPSLSAMICGHCAAGNVDKAMQYFNQLRRCGIAPTGPLFDAILDGCAWMNMPALMEQVLADMEAVGVQPSTSTLTILLRNYGSNGNTDRALAVFDELPKRHGFELDGPAYGALISVCLSNGSFNVAWTAFERMSESGRIPHARTYEALAFSCLRQGHLERAVRILDEALNLAAPYPVEEVVPLSIPRVCLEKKVVEEVLRTIGRRRAVGTLGAPLLSRLQAARIEVSDSLVEAIQYTCRAEAEPGALNTSGTVLQQRQGKFQRWRNFEV